MSCFSPIFAVRVFDDVNKKYRISFSQADLNAVSESEWIPFPCRKCLGCRLDKAQEWAIRGTHELRFSDRSCFLTLTYNNENLPDDGCLHYDHFQNFMKRLRKEFAPGIRFIACGEYGGQKMRPHWHVILFNFSFDDAYKFCKAPKGNYFYSRSATLEKLWKFGFSWIGDVTYESIAYVCRYTAKKEDSVIVEHEDFHGLAFNERLFKHHEKIAELGLTPERFACSRRPGIGFQFFSEFKRDMFPHGFCINDRGQKRPVPSYYIRKLKEDFPDLYLDYENALQDRLVQYNDEEFDGTKSSYLALRERTARLAIAERKKSLRVRKLLPRVLDDFDM